MTFKELSKMKQSVCIILASLMMLLALTFCIPAYAETPDIGKVADGYVPKGTPITSAAEFYAMESNGGYYLANDITIDSTWNAGAEVTANYKSNAAFTGTLDGNGKTITTSVPLFANLQGVVKNLTVEGTLAESDLHAANISLWTCGTIVVDNVLTKADIPSGQTSGGIIGYASTGANITITNSQNDADIVCSGQVGGMVGYIQDYHLTIKNCVNNGNLTTSNYGAGIVGRSGRDKATYPTSSCTISNCINNGIITSAKGQSAGILGFLAGTATITDCVNNGNIINELGAAGGIFGMHVNNAGACGILIENCANYGEIRGVTYTAGIAARVGRSVPHPELSYRTVNCVNYGVVNAIVPEGIVGDIYVGGIVAYAYGKKASLSNGVVNCINIGTINADISKAGSVTYIGGILGYVNALTYEVKNNINAGSINITGTPTVATLTAYNRNLDATDVFNNYSVASGEIAAGLVGEPDALAKNPKTYVSTNEDLESGKVAYLINKAAGQTVYYQSIGADSLPGLKGETDGSDTVYRLADGSFSNIPDETSFYTPGDLNNDGKVNIRDAALLLQYIAGKDVECINVTLDTNGDGNIDISDAKLITQHLTDWADSELSIGDKCSHSLTHHEALEATETSHGSSEFWTCSVCEKIFKDEKASVATTEAGIIIHFEGDWTVSKEAGVSEEGLKILPCTVCGAVLDSETIPATGSLGLSYTLNKAGTAYSVSGLGTCTDTEVVIPSTYEGLPVIAILDYSFMGYTKITSVTVSEGVTEIGGFAFDNCKSLESVTLPDSLEALGNCVFSNCTSLKNLEIPKNVYSIGVKLVDGCTSLESISVSEKNIYFTIKYNCLIDIDAKSIIAGFGAPSIPSDGSVTSIYNSALAGLNMTSLVIPDCITNIDNRAFAFNDLLETVYVGSGVSSIGNEIFCGCNNIKSFTVSDNNTTFSSVNNCFINNAEKSLIHAFGDFKIPSDGSVTSIAASAFNSRSDITDFTVPNFITAIGQNIFYGCPNLTKVTLNAEIKTIPNHAFANCTSLEIIEIPYGITTISSFAFHNCTALESVKIPSSITHLDHNAFGKCTAISSFIFDGGEAAWNDITKNKYWNSGCSFTVSFAIPSCDIHTSIAVEATEPTCTEEGNTAYWYCSVCLCHWSDEALTTPITSTAHIIPMKHNALLVPAKAPTDTEDGYSKHWYCSECDGYWLDEDLKYTTNLEALTIPAGTILPEEPILPEVPDPDPIIPPVATG